MIEKEAQGFEKIDFKNNILELHTICIGDIPNAILDYVTLTRSTHGEIATTLSGGYLFIGPPGNGKTHLVKVCFFLSFFILISLFPICRPWPKLVGAYCTW